MRAAAVWFACSTLALVAPAFTVLGNHVYPRVFGLPWSLVYVLGVIALNFFVLLGLYRARVVDSDEVQEHGGAAAPEVEP